MLFIQKLVAVVTLVAQGAQCLKPFNKHYNPNLPTLIHGGGDGNSKKRSNYCGNQTSGLLKYHGGPVKNKIDVRPLFWPNVQTGAGVAFASDIDIFYKVITDSNYIDMLFEYCTVSYGKIEHGTGRNALTLSDQPQNHVLDDGGDIKPYLLYLVNSGQLSPNNNSYYPIHFGPGITITKGKESLCNDFCGYHNAVNVGTATQPIYLSYGVLPDLVACGASCSLGIHNPLADVTHITSHELIEVITDPTLLAWYDKKGQENADLCAWHTGNVTDANNRSWTVTYGWSNYYNACYLP